MRKLPRRRQTQTPKRRNDMSSPDPDFVQAAADFKRGGWLVALLGVAGALVRLLLSEDKLKWVCWVKHAIAGGLTGVVVYFALHGTDIDPLYKSVIYSSSGAIAPRLFEYIDSIARKMINKSK
jgi:hypothetical protein